MKDNKGGALKGGKTMEIKRSTLIWVVIGILLIATIYLTFKASSIGTGAATTTATAAQNAIASTGMVGGC